MPKTPPDHAIRAHALRNWSSKEWLDCDRFIEFKNQEEAGLLVTYERDEGAANRGTKLHEVLETLLRKLVDKPDVSPIKLLNSPLVQNLGEPKDISAVSTAFHAVRQFLKDNGWPATRCDVAFELKVTIPHEPDQKAHVDLVIILHTLDDESEDVLILAVIDHKFGILEVDPNGSQNRGYAYSILKALEAKGMEFDSVMLGINQPEANEDILFAETLEPEELHRWGHWVEVKVERQEEGLDRAFASNIETCKYCPYKVYQARDTVDGELRNMACPANQRMLTEGLDVAEEIIAGNAKPETIDRFYRGKATFTEALKQARQMILDDAEAFPNYTRSSRKGNMSWDYDKAEADEIAHEIRLHSDIENPYVLRTPAQIRDMFEKGSDLEWLMKFTSQGAGFYMLTPKKLDVDSE